MALGGSGGDALKDRKRLRDREILSTTLDPSKILNMWATWIHVKSLGYIAASSQQKPIPMIESAVGVSWLNENTWWCPCSSSSKTTRGKTSSQLEQKCRHRGRARKPLPNCSCHQTQKSSFRSLWFDRFANDGFHQVKCCFQGIAMRSGKDDVRAQMWPSSINLLETIAMQTWELSWPCRNDGESNSW